jgi:hypothetical protein
MLLFECLELDPTPGLLQRNTNDWKDIDKIKGLKVDSEDAYVDALRLASDLESIEHGVSAVYDPFAQQLEGIMQRLDAIRAEGRRLRLHAPIGEDSPENRIRMAEHLAEWAAWLDTVIAIQTERPDITRRLAALHRLMGTNAIIEP